MSKSIKKCQECQQTLKEEKVGDKIYQITLKKKEFYSCPTCWENKKDDYKEQLKEEKWEEAKRNSRSLGSSRKIYKDSSEVIGLVNNNCVKTWDKNQFHYCWSNRDLSRLW